MGRARPVPRAGRAPGTAAITVVTAMAAVLLVLPPGARPVRMRVLPPLLHIKP